MRSKNDRKINVVTAMIKPNNMKIIGIKSVIKIFSSLNTNLIRIWVSGGVAFFWCFTRKCDETTQNYAISRFLYAWVNFVLCMQCHKINVSRLSLVPVTLKLSNVHAPDVPVFDFVPAVLNL